MWHPLWRHTPFPLHFLYTQRCWETIPDISFYSAGEQELTYADKHKLERTAHSFSKFLEKARVFRVKGGGAAAKSIQGGEKCLCRGPWRLWHNGRVTSGKSLRVWVPTSSAKRGLDEVIPRALSKPFILTLSQDATTFTVAPVFLSVYLIHSSGFQSSKGSA